MSALPTSRDADEAGNAGYAVWLNYLVQFWEKTQVTSLVQSGASKLSSITSSKLHNLIIDHN